MLYKVFGWHLLQKGLFRGQLPFLLLLFSCSVTSDSSITPWTVAHQAPLSVGFPRQEYWSGLPCPPSGDLPRPEIEPASPTLPTNSLPLSHQGSARILEWIAYPFSCRSSRPRNWTGVSCIAGGFFTSWATREDHLLWILLIFL